MLVRKWTDLQWATTAARCRAFKDGNIVPGSTGRMIWGPWIAIAAVFGAARFSETN